MLNATFLPICKDVWTGLSKPIDGKDREGIKKKAGKKSGNNGRINYNIDTINKLKCMVDWPVSSATTVEKKAFETEQALAKYQSKVSY